MELKRIIEAILFVSPRPLTIKALAKKIDEFSETDIENALKELIEEYTKSDRALVIAHVAGGYQMRTKIELKDWVKRFVREKDVELTRPTLEALAIIAYKQPVTKREIDIIRGVDSSRALKQLLDRKLIEIAGRNEDIGRPMVFRTTSKFLEVYGLSSIKDLPTLKEIEALEK
ncbi:MAG TPA: SMC-Scp complex subunit ScpB [Syntrophorhabdaceae bacterium]|nr:SMC-Scp complex subunit ScpB [Syntrophorhabdaceae bacterium]HPU29672.1 SMC-Scp complex subunit ScpB [Syntrophorhabdaceae bacterium]